MTPNQLAAISRFFSAAVIREMCQKGRSPLLVRLARESVLLERMEISAPVRDLFSAGYEVLKRKNHRHEYIYKAALTEKILLGKHSLQTASMMQEFRVADCKADVVILNGTATVYEIKSERDSLTRLAHQVATYRTVFAKVYVIAGENHVQGVSTIVPDDVGILLLSDRYQISTVRDAIDAPERTNSAAIFDSIRVDEARQILAMNGISVPDVPNTERYRTLRSFFVQLEPNLAHLGMVSVLKKNRSLVPLGSLISELPSCLQTAALTCPMRKSDHQKLINAVNTPIEEAMTWA